MTNMKKENRLGMAIALGAGLGVMVGTVVGAVMGNVGLGISMGIALGAGIGVAFGVVWSNQDEEEELIAVTASSKENDCKFIARKSRWSRWVTSKALFSYYVKVGTHTIKFKIL